MAVTRFIFIYVKLSRHARGELIMVQQNFKKII